MSARGERARAWWRRSSRRTKAAVALASLFALFLAIRAFAGEAPEEGTEAGPAASLSPPVGVAAVGDGDTITLASGVRVRLVQIDAPELGEGECYARRSAAELRRIVPPGTSVRLEADPTLDDVDRYGRELRYVFEGEENVNLLLVRRGAASVWFYRGARGRYAGSLLAAAREAKAARRGLWEACPGTALDPFQAVATRNGRPSPPPPPPPPAPSQPVSCHPSYAGACLDRRPLRADRARTESAAGAARAHGAGRTRSYFV